MKTKIFYDFEDKIQNINCNTSLCDLDFKTIVSDTLEKDLYYIYFLVDTADKSVFYVGKGKKRRCFIHEWGVKNNQNLKNPHKYRKIKNLLKSQGYFIVIPFTNYLESKVLQKEVEYIKYFGRDRLCNLTDGGEFNPMNDFVTKEKVRQFHTGRKRNKETCKKISKARKGNPLTKEHCKKIQNSLLGNKRAGHKVKVIFQNSEEQIFNSINEMKLDNRINAHTVTISKKLKESKNITLKGLKYIKL